MNGAEWWLMLDKWGFQTAWLLLSALWQSSILLAAAGLLALALRRSRPSVRHAILAGAILASPLIPLLGWAASKSGTPQAPIPVVPGYSPPPVAMTLITPDEAARPAEPLPGAPEISEAEPIPETDHVATTAQQQGPPPAAKTFSLLAYPWAIVLPAYAVGAAGMLCLVAVGKYRIGRWARRGRAVTDPRILAIFRSAQQRLGLHRDVTVVESGRILSPITVGTLQPVILLPAAVARQSSEDDLLAVALHELAHVRRCDSLLLTLLSLVRAALFFHPLIWLACRQVSTLAESACDDAVLDATGEPVSYAKMLARLAEQLPRHALATELAAGIVWSRGAFLRRVEAILSDRRDQIRKLTRMALLGTLIAAAGSVALALALPLGEKNETHPATQPEGGITPTPETATVLCITPKWMLWNTHELIEATATHRAQSFIIRFYLQRRGDERARLVKTTEDTNVRWRATVLDNGTVFLNCRGRLAWVSPDGKFSSTPELYPTINGRSMEPLGLYPDGVILRTMQLKDEPVRAWFVPIDKEGMVTESKVALTDDKGFRQNTSAINMHRHGNCLAWLDGNELNVVDIATGERKVQSVRLRYKGDRVRAFDGLTMATSSGYFDVATGRKLGLDDDEYRPVFAVRNGIGYFLRPAGRPDPRRQIKTHLIAVHLDSARQRTRVLAEFMDSATSGGVNSGVLAARINNFAKYGYVPMLFAAEREGLLLWDGTAWRRFKWLTRIDQQVAAGESATQPAEKAESPDAHIAKLIAQLGGEGHEQREKAQQELVKIGPAAMAALETASGDADPERAARVRQAAKAVRVAVMAAEADQIVLASALRVREVTERQYLKVLQVLKGSSAGDPVGVEWDGAEDKLPPGGGKTWIVFLRVEEDGRQVPKRYAVRPAGWFLPHTDELEKRVREVIPLPKEWGEALKGLRMGLRVRGGPFAVGKDMPVEIAFANVSDGAVSMLQIRYNIYDYYPGTTFEVTTPGGKRLTLSKPEGPIREHDSPRRRTLQPGETYIHTVRLNRWPQEPRVHANLFAEPGEYRIKCVHKPLVPDGMKDVWRGQLESPPAAITILAAKPEAAQAGRLVRDPVAAIRATLPAGWIIQKVEEGTQPFYLVPGKGKGIYLGRPLDRFDPRDRKTPYEMVLWLMPPDYSGRLADRGGDQQTPTPRQIATLSDAKVYLWGAWAWGDAGQTQKKILAALVSPAADQEGPPEERAVRLIERLASPNFEDRQAAEKELVAMGLPAVPALMKASRHEDPEIAARARRAWKAITPLRVTLVHDKQEYFLGENVLLHYRIANEGEAPFTIHMGGDGRTPGAKRAIRFKIEATDATGRTAEDPWPNPGNFGGPAGNVTLKPGEDFWEDLQLLRYREFTREGAYTIAVYHDLGWDKDTRRPNEAGVDYSRIPPGPHKAPIATAGIRLIMPTEQQARQIVEETLKLRSEPGRMWGRPGAPYADFELLRYPVYLPIMKELAEKGDLRGLDAIGAMTFPDATAALLELTKHRDSAVATKAKDLLLWRMPHKSWPGRPNRATYLADRSWRDDLKAQAAKLGWDLLATEDRDDQMRGGRIVQSLGGADDLPALIKVMNKLLAAYKDHPTEQAAHLRPATVSDTLAHAARRLVERGAQAPPSPATAGEAVPFLVALKSKEDFRPPGWQATAEALLNHDIPFVRALALANIPLPLSESAVAVVAKRIKDDYEPVQGAACDLAERAKSARFRQPLLDVLAATPNEWVLGGAFRAGLACGADRDRALEILVGRLDRFSNQFNMVALSLMIDGAVDSRGGYGASRSHGDWQPFLGEMRKAWREFIETNRHELRQGKQFKVGQKPLKREMFPPQFQFYPAGRAPWPDWSAGDDAKPAPTTSSRPATQPAGISWGPVRTFTLSVGHLDFALDLDSGETQDPPAKGTLRESMDAMPAQTQPMERPKALLGLDGLKGLAVANGQWDADPVETRIGGHNIDFRLTGTRECPGLPGQWEGSHQSWHPAAEKGIVSPDIDIPPAIDDSRLSIADSRLTVGVRRSGFGTRN